MANDHRRIVADEFADQRLPDLPNAGYSTKRERGLSDAIMFFIRNAERDRLYLLSLVCDGEDKFTKVFMKAFRFLRVDREMTHAVWGYLVLLAGQKPEEQLEQLKLIAKWSPYQRVWGPRG